MKNVKISSIVLLVVFVSVCFVSSSAFAQQIGPGLDVPIQPKTNYVVSYIKEDADSVLNRANVDLGLGTIVSIDKIFSKDTATLLHHDMALTKDESNFAVLAYNYKPLENASLELFYITLNDHNTNTKIVESVFSIKRSYQPFSSNVKLIKLPNQPLVIGILEGSGNLILATKQGSAWVYREFKVPDAQMGDFNLLPVPENSSSVTATFHMFDKNGQAFLNEIRVDNITLPTSNWVASVPKKISGYTTSGWPDMQRGHRALIFSHYRNPVLQFYYQLFNNSSKSWSNPIKLQNTLVPQKIHDMAEALGPVVFLTTERANRFDQSMYIYQLDTTTKSIKRFEVTRIVGFDDGIEEASLPEFVDPDNRRTTVAFTQPAGMWRNSRDLRIKSFPKKSTQADHEILIDHQRRIYSVEGAMFFW